MIVYLRRSLKKTNRKVYPPVILGMTIPCASMILPFEAPFSSGGGDDGPTGAPARCLGRWAPKGDSWGSGMGFNQIGYGGWRTGKPIIFHGYPLVNIQKTMENHHF